MSLRKIIVAGALLAPALVFVSCNSESTTNPSVPDTPGITQVTPDVRLMPRVELRGQLAARAAKTLMYTTTTTPTAPHDPTVVGMLLTCFSGVEVGPPFPGIYGGVAKRFKNDRGCELNNIADPDPDGNVSGAFPTSRSTYTGVRLIYLHKLEFFFAGGPIIGGAPRINVPIDECESVQPPSSSLTTQTTTISTAGCAPGTATDGYFDGTLFADAAGCNDGDGFVGALKLTSDPSCLISYTGVVSGTYANWNDFKAAHPGARVARRYDAVTSGTGSDEPADILIIADQPVHYLVYRGTFN